MLKIRNTKILDETLASDAAFYLAHGTPVMFGLNIVSRVFLYAREEKR
jgi:hypothetical protein